MLVPGDNFGWLVENGQLVAVDMRSGIVEDVVKNSDDGVPSPSPSANVVVRSQPHNMRAPPSLCCPCRVLPNSSGLPPFLSMSRGRVCRVHAPGIRRPSN